MDILNGWRFKLKGKWAKVFLKGTGRIFIEKCLRFELRDSKIQEKYKALVSRMNLAREVVLLNTFKRELNSSNTFKGYKT